MSTLPEIGFFGKLPSHGDFLRRNVSDSCVEHWDPWLQTSMAASRQALTERWLELYLTAPMWRFFAPPGLIDAQAVTGVLFPSVDRVGRYFPLTVFARLAEDVPGLVLIDNCSGWYQSIEDLVVEQLGDQPLPLADFESRLVSSLEPLRAGAELAAGSRLLPTEGATHLHLPLDERLDMTRKALAWLDERLRQDYSHPAYWLSTGSARVGPCWLVTSGLPGTEAYAAMLSGEFDAWPWNSRAQKVFSPAAFETPAPLRIESAGITHTGKVRRVNQDALLLRPEAGLWMVADGMGGHSDGHVASQMTRDALADLTPEPTMHELIDSVRKTLEEVNTCLHASALRPVNPTVTGTTVVVLLIRGNAAACLWAGDSRLYRLRDVSVEQLTRDHDDSGVNSAMSAREQSSDGNVITRAIGGTAELELDQIAFEVRPGDRFLLCSDGVYRELTAEELHRGLGTPGAEAAARGLTELVLHGAAMDNLTALVVDILPGTG
jgi:type VI secretion system protein ImpM